MQKQLSSILVIISVLAALLFIGFPIEFRDRTAERIARIAISIIIILIFYTLFYFSRKLNSKMLKTVLSIILSILALPYLLVFIYNLSTSFSTNYSRWEDIVVTNNEDGKWIVHQVRETSGSIYDYRYRRIFYENRSLRISINCHFGRKSGW